MDIPENFPMAFKAAEYSKPAATSLRGSIKVAKVSNTVVDKPLRHKGNDIIRTLKAS